MTALTQRHDFVVLFDVLNGNPNGDPDAGNLPRLDPETNRGLVTDVCLKRKIRNYVDLAREGTDGFHIYVQEGALLNDVHRTAYEALRPGDPKNATNKSLQPKDDAEAAQLRAFMCQNFYDVRTFGAVMSTGINCGQVRGPVQLSFATSQEPIVPQEISITRMAATTEKEKSDWQKSQRSEADPDKGDERTDHRTMGRKYIVPYALYRAHGFVSAKLAERTGFSDADLDLLLTAVENMFEHDRSAARGEMTVRKLIVFKHACALGNAPAHTLFERVRVGRQVAGAWRALGDPGLETLPPARSFTDYAITLDRDALPEGVEMIERL
ncbi:type I-C CRISPR-associated protein Cas7/Csd2 [Pararhodospirillum oryzae]|uniref:Type I-C CRISPR-associated protein Cas7/Csd2 n=1 Tax=Pararhodospirillum oryzae TaxID=478448 RepID=A0A512H8S5_9PROT|nr:type I-C CRISPR-associated protein Cas7/Csd2 [Pararhodospirillum oryzae]GEO81851.1 type I-C CRISPR-associated protein Cas7/Csd2 [Pararhodospirillum oryzae]